MLCMMEEYALPLMGCAQVCDLSWAGSASAPKKGPDARCRERMPCTRNSWDCWVKIKLIEVYF